MDQPPLGSPDAPAGPSLLRHTLASTARATAATWLLILLPAYAEWRIATRQAPPGAVDGRTVELAIAAPLAVVFVQLVVNLCVMTSIYTRARDELTRLAGAALAIAAGRRAEVPRRLYSVGAREVAEALRKWQEAASVREALLASAPVGICLLDRMGVIRTANPALRAMLGYERDELEGHAMLEFVHLDDLHLALDLTPAAMAAAGVDRAMVEARHRRSDGSWLWCAGVLAPLGADPERPDGFVVILEDISERRREAERAAQIQREMLPQSPPALDGWQVAGTCQPAADVAGDLFDWEEADGHLDLTVADVMGKGLGSALVMATLRTALRMAPRELGPAARVAQVAGSMVFGTAADGLFVTLVHGRLELATGRLRYVDAGHGYGLVLRADGAVERLAARSLPLGLGLGERFQEGEVRLQPGDALLLCSDGLVENDAGCDLETLAAAVAGAASAEELVDRALRCGSDGRRTDDVTVLALHRLGGIAAAAPPAAAAPAGRAADRALAADADPRPASPTPSPTSTPEPEPDGDDHSGPLLQFLTTPSLIGGFSGLVVMAGLVTFLEWRLGTSLVPAGRARGGDVALAVGGGMAAAVAPAALLMHTILSSVQHGLSPLPVLAARARRIAAGHRVAVPYEDRADFIGDLARALCEWRDTAAVRDVVLENAPVGICLLDERGAIRHANRTLLAMLGYEAAQLASVRLLGLVHPDDRHLAGRMTPELLASAAGERAVAEARLRRGDGSWLWCEAAVAPVRLAGGASRGFVVILTDIGDRKREAERAAQIQRDMLPQAPPALDGWDLAGACRPAREVGGDLFDWELTPDGGLQLTVADVMGKSMGSALVMAALRTALRMAPAEMGPAAQIARLASSMTFGAMDEGLFVTLFRGLLDPDTGRLRYVDAGHGYCLVRRADACLERLGARSLPLGVWPEDGFREGEVRLGPGDLLLVCSDGLVELGDQPDSLEDVARELDGEAEAAAAVARLLARVPEGRQSDDVTAIVLRRRPPAASGRRRPLGSALPDSSSTCRGPLSGECPVRAPGAVGEASASRRAGPSPGP